MPLLAHGINHTALNGSPTGPANGDTHLVMAGQTVELPLQLPRISCQLLTAEKDVNEGLSGVAQLKVKQMQEIQTKTFLSVHTN